MKLIYISFVTAPFRLVKYNKIKFLASSKLKTRKL